MIFFLVLMMWKVHSQENFILFFRENSEKLFESMLTNTIVIFFWFKCISENTSINWVS